MTYWFYKEELWYEDWQFPAIEDKSRLDFKVGIDDETWNTLRAQAEAMGVPIVNNPETNMPMLGEPHQAPESDRLLSELEEHKSWIESQAFIGTLLSTGVATREELAPTLNEIANRYARINEINQRLAELGV